MVCIEFLADVYVRRNGARNLHRAGERLTLPNDQAQRILGAVPDRARLLTPPVEAGDLIQWHRPSDGIVHGPALVRGTLVDATGWPWVWVLTLEGEELLRTDLIVTVNQGVLK